MSHLGERCSLIVSLGSLKIKNIIVECDFQDRRCRDGGEQNGPPRPSLYIVVHYNCTVTIGFVKQQGADIV